MKKYSFDEFVELIKSRVSQIEFEPEKYKVIKLFYNEAEQDWMLRVTYDKNVVVNFNFYPTVKVLPSTNEQYTVIKKTIETSKEYPEWYQNYLNRGVKEYVIVDDYLRAHQGDDYRHGFDFYLDKYFPLGRREHKATIAESFKEYNINKDDILFDSFSQSYLLPLKLSDIFAQKSDDSIVDIKGKIMLYKYMSLDTFRCILNNRTFRMNSIVSMNDIYEGEWMNHLLFGTREINDESELRTSYLDNRKILIASLSGNRDDASMWRYYGKDGAGVCLCVECPVEEVNKVIYTDKNADNIKKFNDKITKLKDKGICIRLKEDGNLRYFIKSTAFQSENEYRFVYDASKDNLQLANYNGILSPFEDFNIESDGSISNLPIKLKGVIIGHNIPNYNTNAAILIDQIHEMFPTHFFIYESQVKEIR
jgi:hypothetical protein